MLLDGVENVSFFIKNKFISDSIWTLLKNRIDEQGTNKRTNFIYFKILELELKLKRRQTYG